MKRAKWLLLPMALLFLAGCAAPKADAPHAGALSYEPLSFSVKQIRPLALESGANLYLLEDPELPLVELTLMVEAGDGLVPASKTGLGDLFASALRTGGTASLSPEEVDARLAAMAASLSVTTDTYLTRFHLSVHRDSFEPALAILLGLLTEPAFEPQALEIARSRMLEAVRRRNDQPSGIAQRALAKAVYDGHPLGQSPRAETLSAIARSDLTDFHEAYFHPCNVRIGISGDFSPEQVRALLTQALGRLSSQSGESRTIAPLASPDAPKLYFTRKDISQTTVLMGRRGFDKDDPDLYAARVMNYILGGGGFNSRLMREIRSNRGLAYSVYSYFQVGRRLPGLFILGAETRNDAVAEVVELMRQEMEKMRQVPVTAKELQGAKESLVNSFVFAFTDSHEVLTQSMRLDIFDYPPDYLERFRERIAAVGTEDVRRVARRFLDPAELNLILVGDLEESPAKLEQFGLPVVDFLEWETP